MARIKGNNSGNFSIKNPTVDGIFNKVFLGWLCCATTRTSSVERTTGYFIM